MPKSPDSIKKACEVKKINKMSKEVCEKELARLNGVNKNKDGVVMGDNSKYKADVEARLKELSN